MTSSPAAVNWAGTGSSTAGFATLERRFFYLLSFLALTYAFLAGLRTVSDFDLGWQLATGRWVAQHHHVPSVDVFSYTVAGEPWVYPVGSGLVFYFAYLQGGYALISWIGAAACAGSIALLLRRNTAVGAALAILAVPLIAWRTSPRADMFSVVLFTAFLSLLWENYRTGRARLWLLPLLMLAWVNLHLGFAAGLALLFAYVGVELSETIFGEARRRNALLRLRHAYVWLIVTVFATLINPWGWRIYHALFRTGSAEQMQLNVNEWSGVPITWSAFSGALSLRETHGTIHLLLAIAAVAALLAFWQRQVGAAALLLAATYPPVHQVRMGAAFACVVVVVGGPVLSTAMVDLGSHLRQARMRSIAAWTAVCLLALLALLRCFDLVTNRHYARVVEESTFGAGLGWWFPERAVAFVERENLPPEIFNAYDEGGYLTWRLGPERRDYIDGRAIPFGMPRMQRASQLLMLSPDSDTWQQEADRYHINTIILSLARFDGIQLLNLKGFCDSRNWRPVYLDEVSAVFVRRTPETENLIQRFPVDCATASLPGSPLEYSGIGSFTQSANAAAVLAALGRNSEALSATDNALLLFPDSVFVHWLRGNILRALGRPSEEEQEYLTVLDLEPSEVAWTSLASWYQRKGLVPEAVEAFQQASKVSSRPDQVQLKLAQLYLSIQQPQTTLKELDKALRSAPAAALKTTGENSLRFNVAQGRAAAWRALGDLKQATAFQEEAVRLAPDSADAWSHLAKLYQRQGRFEDQYRAEQRASQFANNPDKKPIDSDAVPAR
jgi:tetratricopeptide (TPR) repeat protein